MSGPTPSTGPSLRIHGLVLFVLLIAELLLGNQLAVIGSPYPIGWIAAHVGLALVTIAFSVLAFLVSLPSARVAARASSLVTSLATIGATVSGTLFLYAGGSRGSLIGMEALGGIALLGSILLIVWGSSATPPAAPRPA